MAQFIDETIGASGDSQTADWPGGRGTILVQGMFSGAMLTLQFQVDGSSWTNVISSSGTTLTFTANGMGSFELCPCKVKIARTGGNVNTSIKVRVAPSRHSWLHDGALL